MQLQMIHFQHKSKDFLENITLNSGDCMQGVRHAYTLDKKWYPHLGKLIGMVYGHTKESLHRFSLVILTLEIYSKKWG